MPLDTLTAAALTDGPDAVVLVFDEVVWVVDVVDSSEVTTQDVGRICDCFAALSTDNRLRLLFFNEQILVPVPHV